MDLPSLEQFNSIVSIITGAFEIAKNLAGSKGTPKPEEVHEARAKLIEAELATLELLKQHKTLIAAYEELEEQVEQLKAWGEEKRDYQLAELAPGSHVFAFVYTPKGQIAQPLRWFCEKCYHQDKKSMLHRQHKAAQPTWICFACGTEYPLPPEPFRQTRLAKG